MPADLASALSDPGTAAIGGVAVVAMVAKDVLVFAVKALFGRFLRRSERLETKLEDKHESLFARLLAEVESMRRALDVMVERLTHHQASVSEVRERVDDHGGRINALELGQAELRTKVEFLSSTGGKDD
jgi:hypothetical protein